MPLRFFAKIIVFAVSVNRSCQGRFFGLWTLWKNAKATKLIITTLSAAVYPQNPQPLLLKPQIPNFSKTVKVELVHKIITLTAHHVGNNRLIRANVGFNVGRAHLHIFPKCGISDKLDGILCNKSIFGQGVS
jgi:hypothetical protein